MRRWLAVLHARNLEFLRDRGSLSWNIVVPVLLVIAMAIIFSDERRDHFKVGVLTAQAKLDNRIHPFLDTRYVRFFKVEDKEKALYDVSRHRIDMLLNPGQPGTYWINPDSPNGYVLERLLRASGGRPLARAVAPGERVRYVDWLLPGVLGMNIMFSCLFGVGYVVVRYRKNGFLKRLYATPLRPIEFLAAQVFSRLVLITVVTALVYLGTSYLIGFRMTGSHAALAVTAILGAVSMISLGLLVAARITSEELAGGVLNFISWPMMLLSGVWFSLEGSHPLLKEAAGLLPLTHVLEAARAIMLDGGGFPEVAFNLAVLAIMSAVFLGLGAFLFKWSPN